MRNRMRAVLQTLFQFNFTCVIVLGSNKNLTISELVHGSCMSHVNTSASNASYASMLTFFDLLK